LKDLGVDLNSLQDAINSRDKSVVDLIGEMSNINQVLKGISNSDQSRASYDPPPLEDDKPGYG